MFPNRYSCDMKIADGHSRRAFMSQHAVQRYLERVAPGSPVGVAVKTMEHILQTARVRSKPRRWMKGVTVRPGSRYLYAADHPNVCLVLVGEVVVTVYSRRVCARWAQRE